jgi:PAS domain S-box-containing protein
MVSKKNRAPLPALQEPGTHAASRQKELYRGRFSNRIFVVVWILALLPVLLFGGVLSVYLPNLLGQQADAQLQRWLANQSSQWANGNSARSAALSDLLSQGNFLRDLDRLTQAESGSSQHKEAQIALTSQLRGLLQGASVETFSGIILLDSSGTVLVSTRSDWDGVKISADSPISAALSKNLTLLVNRPAPFNFTDWVFLNTLPIPPQTGPDQYTLVGFTTPLFVPALDAVTAILPNAQLAIFQAGSLSWLDMQGHSPQIASPLSALDQPLGTLLTQKGAVRTEYINQRGIKVRSAAAAPDTLPFSLVVTAPATDFAPSPQNYLPILGGLALGLFLLSGGFAYAAAWFIARPVRALADSAARMDQGPWGAALNEKRGDELGLLARTLRHLADDLSSLNLSFADQVDQQTRPTKIAAEITALATATLDLDRVIQTATATINDRFRCLNTSFYLADETGGALYLQQTAGITPEKLQNSAFMVNIDDQTLPGWAAVNNQPRQVSPVSPYPFSDQAHLLPQAQVELALPVTAGNKVLGVLVLQAGSPDAFPAETFKTLQMLTNQLAGAIQTITNLVSSREAVQTISLLYQASHQVIHAESEAQALQIYATALQQTSYLVGYLKAQNMELRGVFASDPLNKINPSAITGSSTPLEPVQTLFNTPNPLVISDLVSRVPAQLETTCKPFREAGATVLAILPILAGSRFIGLTVIGARDRSLLSISNVQAFANLVEVLTNTIAKAERQRLVEAQKARCQETARLMLELVEKPDFQLIHRALHNHIRQRMGDTGFQIALFHTDTNMVEIPYIFQGDAIVSMEPFPLGQGLTSILIRNKQPVLLVKDLEQQAAALGASFAGKPVKSWLGVPLLYNEAVIGAVVLQDVEHEERFSSADLEFLQEVAPQAAAAYHNAQYVAHLQQNITRLNADNFLFSTLLETTPDRVFFKDHESRYLRANHGTSSQLGISNPNDLVGKTDFDFFEKDTASQVFQEEQEVMLSGSADQKEITLEHHPGKSDTWVQFTRTPIRDDKGTIKGLIGITRDLTQLIIAQETSKRRAQQLQTVAEIARDIANTLHLNDLLLRVVQLARQRFNFYHVAVFIVDSTGANAVLREASGEAGAIMKAAGWSFGVGSKTIVGQVTANGQPLVINAVEKDPAFLPNPNLPETKAELAIPLRVGGRILGALDVQSSTANSFFPEDVSVMMLLADQLSAAMYNSELFAEAEKNLMQHRLLHHITAAAAASSTADEALESAVKGLNVILEMVQVTMLLVSPSDGLLEVKSWAGYDSSEQIEQLRQLRVKAGSGITGRAALNRQVVYIRDVTINQEYIGVNPNVRSEIAIPLIFQDELLGILNIESEKIDAFKENDLEMFGTLGSNLAATLANTRLVERVRRQADRQRQLFEISSKIRRSVDIGTILQTTAEEISKVTGARRASIEISIGKSEQEPQMIPADGKGNGNGKAGNPG